MTNENVEPEIIEKYESTDPHDIDMETDITYTFTVTDDTIPIYTISQQISNWIKTNLEGLKDTQGNTIFGKVNHGYNDSTLKTFGKYPVCDVYIDEIEYDLDFDYQAPIKVNTIVLFYLKGANNHTYCKVCELHDYIMQQFISNEDWKSLTGIVKNTWITRSRLMTQPINKKWGVMGAFELTHSLYR